MNIEQIEDAIESGEPFSLTTVDGKVFEVPHTDFISLPPKASKRQSHAVVYNDEGRTSYLALVSITTLEFEDGANVV